MLRLAFYLQLRQIEGFMASVFELLGVSLGVPDRSTLSRRMAAGLSTAGARSLLGQRAGPKLSPLFA